MCLIVLVSDKFIPEFIKIKIDLPKEKIQTFISISFFYNI